MNDLPYRSQFSWQTLEGDPKRLISYSIQSSECTIPISQDDLLNPDACLVLGADMNEKFCEQTITIHPAHLISRLALIVECATIESYVGRIREYNQTHHGDLIFDNDTKLYRFDISLKPCNASELTLRYVLSAEHSLCIYGLHINLTRNANVVNMLAKKATTIDQAMLECRLNDSKMSEKAIKCKEYVLASMEKSTRQKNIEFENIFNNNVATLKSSSVSDAPSSSKETLQIQPQNPGDPGTTNHIFQFPQFPPFSEALIKEYIDTKMLELEAALDAKLQAMEFRQNKKLDNILSLLECISNKE
ncbi:uncharacterized protein LOC131440419 [Malaya genurostris]|uniref:uncharacterized protein LOC131440419 n=1 Tax=Malaya genurostris TaxID=325434 RepID=UPI0026F40617|nr:uncharacterized protein LOC131440419 [Malaya genurostris]